MTDPSIAGTQVPDTTERSWTDTLGWLAPLAGLACLILFLANTQWYFAFKTIHVLGAIVWLGGGAAITVLALKAQREQDKGALLQIGKQAEWLGTRIFIPSSLVVVAMGFLLIEKSDGLYSYSDFWLMFGLVAWGVSFFVGALFLGPESGRLARMMEEHGPEDAETLARLRRIINVARADVVLIALIAADMVAKPFFT
jgi:uncharacterized membrane protein